MDSSGFRLRVEAELRREFIAACRAKDRTAAQVLRDFMREYVAQNYEAKQQVLFATTRAMQTLAKNV